MGRDLTYSKILTPRSDKNDMALSKKSVSSDIPWWVRTVFYGVCSFYFEVVWTAIYDSVENRDQRLIGYSSVWSFFVYAMSLTNNERIYFAMKGSKCFSTRSGLRCERVRGRVYFWKPSLSNRSQLVGLQQTVHLPLQGNVRLGVRPSLVHRRPPV